MALLRTGTKYSSAFLLACAGALVIAANLTFVYGNSPTKALGFLLPAIILGLWGIGQSRHDAVAAPLAVRTTRKIWAALAAIVALHCLVAVPFCRQASARIDTFTFLRDSCKTLLAGGDPYGATQADIYGPPENSIYYGPGMVIDGRVQVGYPYPPLQLVWALPGYLLGDVRYSFILAVALSAWLLFAMEPRARSLWICAILLLNPLTFYIEAHAWNEPLVLLALCATLYAARRHPRWLPLTLGLFLASKQYNVFALPFLVCLIHPEQPFRWRPLLKLMAVSCAVATATVAPFSLWNSHGLWRDLVVFNLMHPFRHDALSFAVRLPFLLKLRPVLLLVFLVWAVRTSRRTPALFAAGYAVAILLLVSTEMGYANYYFLIAQTFLLAVAAMPEVPFWPEATVEPRRSDLV
ncbi:MAG: hypothetical protein ABSG96_12835 [Terracidiphilus sp.]